MGMSADGLAPGEVTKCVQRYEELQALHGQLQTCLVVVSAELKGLRARIDQLIGSERKAGVGIHRDLTSTKQLLTSVESMLGGGDKTSGVETPRADADVGQPRTPDAVEQPLPLPEQMEEPEVPAPPGVLPDASPDPLQAKRKRIVIGMQCTSVCGVHHRLESGLLSRWEDGLPYCTKCLGRLRYKKKKREKETEQEGGKDADTV